MDISDISLSRPELKPLEQILKREIDKTIAERKALGLSVPKEYYSMITYYNSPLATAQAAYTPSGAIVSINLLMSVYRQMTEEDRNRMIPVMNYFDMVRDFAGRIHENEILAMIENPKEAVRGYEEKLGQPNIERQKKFLQERGRTYDNYKEFIITNSAKVKECIAQMLPKTIDAFENIDFLPLRHEMDHADFYFTPLYARHNNILRKNHQLRHKVMIEGKKRLSKRYARSNMKVLSSDSEVKTLLEIRALFFNHLDMNERSEENVDTAIEKVFNHYNDAYIQDHLASEVLDALVSKSWSHKEMDRQTSNYLFKTVYTENMSLSQLAYAFDADKVNHKIADSILQEVKKWQEVFRKNARLAAEAIGHAYKTDPHKLAEANRAKTFLEYIKICSG